MTSSGSASRPTPSGTRDVLPDEMLQLRGLTRSMVDVLDGAGYGEVRTPSVEYERSMEGAELGPEPAYRFVDEHGDSLVLRSDMTLPIARIAATRYADEQGPLRLSYTASSWRRVNPHSGEPREILQVGAELIGGEADASSLELLEVVAAVLEATGLADWRIAVGHAALAGEAMGVCGVGEAQSREALEALDSGDVASVRRVLGGFESVFGGMDLGWALTSRFGFGAGDRELGDVASAELPSVAELVALAGSLNEKVRQRLIVDFSLRPRLGYHDGLVFEVYDPAIGRPLGAGGRYGGLLERLGRQGSAIGFSLDVELLHEALAGEELGEGRIG